MVEPRAMSDATHNDNEPPPEPNVPGAPDDVPQNAGRVDPDAVADLTPEQQAVSEHQAPGEPRDTTDTAEPNDGDAEQRERGANENEPPPDQ